MLNVAHLFVAIHIIFLQDSSIRIDGCFADWSKDVPRVVDGDDSDGVPTKLELLDLRHDDTYVFLLLDVGRPVNLQKLTGTIEIAVNADGRAHTGIDKHGVDGVDLRIDLTPHDPAEGRPMRGMAVRAFHEGQPGDSAVVPQSGYDVDLRFAPTYASRWFELAIRRELDPEAFSASFDGEETVMRAVYRGPAGEIRLNSPAYRHDLNDREQLDPPSVDISIASQRGDVRVMTWNSNDGAMFDRPGPFRRMLQAVNPDVILWQELPEDIDAATLTGWLTTAFSGADEERWHAVVGAGGGPRRCAVTARTQLHEPAPMRWIPHPVRDEHSVRVAAAVATFNGHQLLLTSVHLKCCGRAGSFEDFQRRRELSAIKRAVHHIYASYDIDATIIGGDFNLVGSGQLLCNFATGLGVDGRHLQIAESFQPGGRFNSTWADRTTTYVPGRLDYLMHSRQLSSVNAFVFNTQEVEAARAARLGVRADDAGLASDHFPVIVDLRIDAKDTRQ